jgi:hypothetical protein
MSDNVAYLETTKTTHICVWVQGEGTRTPAGRWSYAYHPATLCGWRKENFHSRARVLYTLLDELPRFPVCQVCVQVATQAQRLATLTGAVVTESGFLPKIPEENTDA